MTKLTHSFSSIKMFDNCPLRYKLQRVDKAITDPGGEATVYGERVHKHLEDRLRDKAPLPAESAIHEPLVAAVESKIEGATLLVEQELTLNEELNPTGWWDDDAWLRSKLDVLVMNRDYAVVMDWKTGKRRVDFFQLELFAGQVFLHYPHVQRVYSSFLWLKDKAVDKEIYTREQLPAIVDNLLAKVHRIENALETDTWPAKPSGLCRFCPAKHFCDYA